MLSSDRRLLLVAQRSFLEPGERARVTVELGAAQLAFLDESEELAVHPGEYELRVGRSAADIRTTATVEIGGEKRLVPVSRTHTATSSIDDRSALADGNRFTGRE